MFKKIVSFLIIILMFFSVVSIDESSDKSKFFPLPENYKYLLKEDKIKVLKKLIIEINILIVQIKKKNLDNLLKKQSIESGSNGKKNNEFYGYDIDFIDFESIGYYVPKKVKIIDMDNIVQKSKLFIADKDANITGFFMINKQFSDKKVLENKKYLYDNKIDWSDIGDSSLISFQMIKASYKYTVANFIITTNKLMSSRVLSEKILYVVAGKDSKSIFNDKNKLNRFRVIYVKGVINKTAFILVSVAPESKYEDYEIMANKITNGARVIKNN